MNPLKASIEKNVYSGMLCEENVEYMNSLYENMREGLILYENDQIVMSQAQEQMRNSVFKINFDSQNWKNRSMKGMKIFYIYKDLSNMNDFNKNEYLNDGENDRSEGRSGENEEESKNVYEENNQIYGLKHEFNDFLGDDEIEENDDEEEFQGDEFIHGIGYL